MRIVTHPAELRNVGGCHVVPTMGALHEGHASLIRRARESADAILRGGASVAEDPGARVGATPVGGRPPVVVTIFVNPTQFGPNEDFARYPRTLDADLALARDAGADAVFVPSVETIYPRGLDAAQREAAAWDLPPAATEPGLEDRVRPGHFGGVCLVVARLFELCRPQRAFFGEKDWQQLRVVSQMVERERARPRAMDGAGRADGAASGARRFDDLEIVPCPTVRDADGLAMSSRNRYLGPEERRRATALWRAIESARERLASTAAISAAEHAAHHLLNHEGFSVDYATIRDAETLLPPSPAAGGGRPRRMLIAARLTTVRLIDNAPVAI